MAQTQHPKAPYAPVVNVLDVVQRVRDRGLPEVIDNDTLGVIGIPEGNRPRTLAAVEVSRARGQRGPAHDLHGTDRPRYDG